jgi:uncharacterized protein (TIGR03083 family)
MRRGDIREAVREEREKLVGDLKAVPAEAWDEQSLCTDWKVRDVVGHLIRVGQYYRPPYAFGWDLLSFGFRLNKALSAVAIRIGQRPVPELLERLERARYEETLLFRLHYQPLFALNEWVVHGQDIRRPLGLDASFNRDHLIALAEVSTKWYTLGTKDVVRGRRLVATDADFSVGKGPVVQGPMEAVLLALYGRVAALRDLEPQT